VSVFFIQSLKHTPVFTVSGERHQRQSTGVHRIRAPPVFGRVVSTFTWTGIFDHLIVN